MDLGLSGRRAFVSGATQGIGRAVVEVLAAEGADVVLVARDAERLAAVAEETAARHGVRCTWHSADFATPGGAGAAAEAAGEVDVVVNNAGRSRPATLDTPAAEWAESQQLNFLSHLEVIRVLLPGMRDRGWGRIVNVTGTAYRAPLQLNSGTIAKYGLVNTATNLAREVARSGVTVNTVTVGLVESGQIRAADHPVDSMIPMGRLGTPAEVAAAVAFLASDQARYTTGSTVTVDGGADPTLL
jgi:3-oxoacyl-[acyl-carrier protein] reductase